jgi:hypothetical protein
MIRCYFCRSLDGHQLHAQAYNAVILRKPRSQSIFTKVTELQEAPHHHKVYLGT